MAKIEVRGDSDAGSLYVNGRFIRSFWYKDRADADIIAEKLTQALALPDPSVATAQNSHLPEAKPVDREFLNKYLQTLSGMLATAGVVGPVGENALTVEIRAVLDELRKAIGLPTRPLLVPGYVVPASALVSPPAVDIKIEAAQHGWYRITLNGVKVGVCGALDLAQKRVDELRQALGLPLESPVKGAVAPATIKPDVGIAHNGEDILVNGFVVETYSCVVAQDLLIANLRQAFSTGSPYIPTIRDVAGRGYEVWLNGVLINRYSTLERAEGLKQSLNYSL